MNCETCPWSYADRHSSIVSGWCLIFCSRYLGVSTSCDERSEIRNSKPSIGLSHPTSEDQHQLVLSPPHIPYLISHILHRTSNVPFSTSHIPHPTSEDQHQSVLSPPHIPYLISHILHRTSNVPFSTSHIQHPTSHFPHPTSHIPYPFSPPPTNNPGRCRPGSSTRAHSFSMSELNW